jgi:hypothetical protein
LQRVRLTSKAVTGETPSCPARSAGTVASAPIPKGLTTPTAVMATRRDGGVDGEDMLVTLSFERLSFATRNSSCLPAGILLNTRMAENPTRESQQNPQALRMRFFWFVAGAGVNYLLISTPFKWLHAHTTLSDFAISASSVAVGTSFFFVWNYFINFRTDLRKREALPRYLVAVVCMWLVSSGILDALEHFNLQAALHLGGVPLDLNIVATQFLPSGLKFFLYHKWVFPLPKQQPS